MRELDANTLMFFDQHMDFPFGDYSALSAHAHKRVKRSRTAL